MNHNGDEIIELQTRMAYQEDAIAQLNNVVTRQDADIIQLQQHMRLLTKRLSELSFAQDGGADELASERPPHY